MSTRIDYSALLEYRAAADSGPTGILDRYYVPVAAIDALDVRRRAAPLSWNARSGATEMRLQRYTLPLSISASASPPVDTAFPGTPNPMTISVTIENLFSDASISVGYSIPSDISSYAVPVFGSMTVDCGGASGTAVIAPLGSQIIMLSGTFGTPPGDNASISGFIFPGLFFTYEGQPWEADTFFPASWSSSEF